jgi:hypothetical protein
VRRYKRGDKVTARGEIDGIHVVVHRRNVDLI